jgi:hypothetical protein
MFNSNICFKNTDKEYSYLIIIFWYNETSYVNQIIPIALLN